MIARCHNPKHPGFIKYGARGIVVCERWRQSYPAFLEDMGLRPDGLTIDRKNNAGNYEPGNCQWATLIEQASNKRNNVLLTHNGETHTLNEWARRTGLKAITIRRRVIDLGWDHSRALTIPSDRPRDWSRLRTRRDAPSPTSRQGS